jgi:hypothetical protein
MNKWDYGGAYKTLNMNGVIDLPNESKVQVWDLTTEPMPAFLLAADTIFVDPPWNLGNINTFYTKAELPYPPLGDFMGFTYSLFVRIDQIHPRFLFIEIGKEYLGEYLMECKKRYKYVSFYNSTYYHKKDNKCYVIHATSEFKRKRYKELEDLDEEEIIKWVCANHEYQCIGDLCMGLGLVGKYAFENGKTFVGTELNKKRLATLVEYLRSK